MESRKPSRGGNFQIMTTEHEKCIQEIWLWSIGEERVVTGVASVFQRVLFKVKWTREYIYNVSLGTKRG